MALPGLNFVEEANMFEDLGLRFSPDAAIFFFYINDLSQSMYQNTYKHRNVLRIPSYLVRLSMQIWMAKVSSMPPSEAHIDAFHSSVERVIGLCKERDIDLYFVVLGFSENRTSLVWKTFSSNETPCLNLASMVMQNDLILTKKDKHFNPKGCELVANRTSQFIISHSNKM